MYIFEYEYILLVGPFLIHVYVHISHISHVIFEGFLQWISYFILLLLLLDFLWDGELF